MTLPVLGADSGQDETADAAVQRSRALEQLLAGRPALPTRSRYQPLRLGMIGIWQYDEQEFFFHDGKLILRGPNGSGKTKALEVTSPLLFDAILSARRIDPFGNSSRSMIDNLLYGGRRQQVGYVWTEYGRVTETGSYQFLTIGIGIHAWTSHSKAMQKQWFFVTDKRVNVDFSLKTRNSRPLQRAGLAQVLGEDCVYRRAKDYRAAVADRLFGFSASRLHALVELLLTLRKPKLSEDFDSEKLSDMLRNSLPPVSAGVIEDLATKFDELAREREEMETLLRDRTSVAVFLESYTGLARTTVRFEAAQLLASTNKHREAELALGRASTTLAHAQAEAIAVREAHDRLKLRRNVLQARVVELQARPEMHEHGVITELQRQVLATEIQLEQADSRLSEASQSLVEAQQGITDASERHSSVLALLEDLEHRAVLCAAGTALAAVHDGERERIRREPASARATLQGAAASRRHVLESVRRLAAALRDAQAELAVTERACNILLKQRDEARTARDARRTDVAARMEELTRFLSDWAARCRQLVLTPVRLDSLLGAAEACGQPGALGLNDLIAPLHQHTARRLLESLADIRSALEALEGQREDLKVERAAVAAQVDPPPQLPPTARRDRHANLTDGTALWKLLDFAPHLDVRARANIEAALHASGLLDAWVTPHGTALDPDTLETVLLAGDAVPRSLADVLCAVEHPAVPAATTLALLRSISLGSTQDPAPGDSVSHACVGTDGSWQLGPLQGRTSAPVPVHIGAAAREAARLRRLAHLDGRITDLTAEVARTESNLAHLRERLDDLDAEAAEARDRDAPLSQARLLLATAELLFQQREEDAEGTVLQLRQQAAEVQGAQMALEDYAKPRSAPVAVEEIDLEWRALEGYNSAVIEVLHAAEDCLRAEQDQARAAAVAARSVAQHDARTEEYSSTQTLLATISEKLRVRREAAGSGPELVLAHLRSSEEEISEIDDALGVTLSRLQSANGTVGGLESALTAATGALAQEESDLQAQAAQYRRLDTHGYLALVDADDPLGGSVADVQAHAVRLSHALADSPWSEQARNDARNDTDKAFRRLEADLGGPDWRPRAENDGALLRVTVWHNGVARSVPDVQGIMDDEISTRRTMMDEREHKLFTEVLLSRLGDHLRRRRADATQLVEHMNTLLSQVPTASGHLMKLIWEPVPKQDASAVLVLLRGSSWRGVGQAASLSGVPS